MGRTILDMDGRRTEVVNDIQLLFSKGRMIVVHVDTSFNGFLRKWGLGRLRWNKDQLISWRYVQPLSIEDASGSDIVSLSITRKQIKELPGEDLADALEELTGKEQQAIFSALDSEKAAEVLVEAEPRAQRQLIADLKEERARAVLGEMTVPQLAALLAVLPHDDKTDLARLLTPDVADRVRNILAARETKAHNLATPDYVAFQPGATVGEVWRNLRTAKRDTTSLSYVYVIAPETKTLSGVVDLRELVVAPDSQPLQDLMASPVVTADENDDEETVIGLFGKYHFRLLPVVDAHDHMVGVIRHGDIMRNVDFRAKE
jgi:Mg/Co/Ni transporter MgtE